MIQATVFNLSSGELARVVTASDEQILYQPLTDTELMVPQTAPPRTNLTHYLEEIVVEGEVVGYAINAYSTTQAAAKASLPTYPARWDNHTMAWLDLRDVETERAQKLTFLIGTRDDLISRGRFVWDSGTYVSDPQTVSGAALGALTATVLSTSYEVTWTLADDSTRTLNASEMLALGQAQSAFVNACHQALRDAKTALVAATTIAAINAVSLSITQPYTP